VRQEIGAFGVMNQHLKKLLVLLHCSLSNHNLVRQIKTSERNLQLSDKEMVDLQWRKLSALLRHAFVHCPFYRRKYEKAGISPERIRNFDDFRRVPILTKKELRDNIDMIIARDLVEDSLEEVYTSGTTGTPLKIYRDKSKTDIMNALYLRTIRYWGCDIGAKTGWLWGVPRESQSLYDYRYQSRLQRFIKNETWFNAFDVTEENMLGFAKLMQAFRPDLIISHMSILSEFANFLVDNAISINRPRAVWVTAEPSSHSQRRFIEKVFRTRTFDQYGTTEVLHIAAECNEREGLHVHADSRFVEILNSSGSVMPVGRVGNVVITDLENRAMPLIRYVNGDISSWKGAHCRCGMSLPLISKVEGRILDTIVLKDGTRIYGHIFAQILHRYGQDVKQFQVHQTAVDEIVIRVVPNGTDLRGRLEDNIIEAMREYTGSLVDYSFENVKEIKREKSGKLRHVKSDLAEVMD
jgi:phenylacetate-CoA ligase